MDELAEGIAWDYGPFPGQLRVLADSETVVSGQPARVQEIEAIVTIMPYAAGDLYKHYIVELSPSQYLIAQTINYRQEEYDTDRLILDQMMRTLKFTST